MMILRNLGPFVPIIKEAWEKTIVVSKFLCFLHVTNTYLIGSVTTYGPSMLPAIDLTTNMFLMERISTRFGKVARGDIVVLRHPQDPRRFMTKRVVGLEGDSVTYISNPEACGLEGDKHETIVVPQGRVWVEGDNKYKSYDSRKFGPVPYDLIQGKIYRHLKILDLSGINDMKQSIQS
ncbi:Mitochondrial inner membrane protease subunit 1, partial [Mucuna pruriens]